MNDLVFDWGSRVQNETPSLLHREGKQQRRLRHSTIHAFKRKLREKARKLEKEDQRNLSTSSKCTFEVIENKNNFRILVDAEQSYVQKAIESISEQIQEQYNKAQLYIIPTIQNYLKRSVERSKY